MKQQTILVLLAASYLGHAAHFSVTGPTFGEFSSLAMALACLVAAWGPS